MKNDEKSCGCGCDFNNEINELVKEGEKPTREEHQQKKEEVEAAFVKKEDSRKK